MTIGPTSVKNTVLTMLRAYGEEGLPVRRSTMRAHASLKDVKWGTIKTAISRLRSEGYDIQCRSFRDDPEYQLNLVERTDAH